MVEMIAFLWKNAAVKKILSTRLILGKLAFWLFLGIVVAITATAMFSDYKKVGSLLASIELIWLPFIVLSVLSNYLLRFVKWCYLLRVVGVKVPFWQNMWIFFSAFTMVLSPGKIGELVKSFLLRERFAIPVTKTAPVVMAERLTDLLGLMALCLIGFSQFAFGGKTLLIVAALLFCGILMLSNPGFWKLVDHFLAKFARFAKFRRPIKIIQESTMDLFSIKSLLLTTPLSAISWAGEGFALYLIFRSMGLDMPALFAISIFAHAFSSIVGALSFLPGGLLVTEGAMGMFFVYVSIPEAQAISATFLIRAVTLWFAVLLGTTVFLLGHSKSDLKALQFISQNKNSSEDCDEAEISE